MKWTVMLIPDTPQPPEEDVTYPFSSKGPRSGLLLCSPFTAPTCLQARICAYIHTTKCLYVLVVPVLEMLWNNITDLEGIWEWKQTSLFLVRLLGWVSSKQPFQGRETYGLREWIQIYFSVRNDVGRGSSQHCVCSVYNIFFILTGSVI